ncbi:MAG TPA: rhomboid family intramembrane serine protease [Thermoanaerobaculia bacterium]|nr:rhomboid family intramembrane serine protease [Thermoanaerobaculia bacterium]
MLQRKRTGSILCPSCGKLVGVSDEQCFYCGRKNPGMWGLSSVLGNLGRTLSFGNIVVGGCGFLFMASVAVMAMTDPENLRIMAGFQILPPGGETLLRFGAAGAWPVFQFGRWWTLLSAGWLHGDLIHIAFNLYWVRLLAPATAELYGASRMIIVYTLSTIIGFLVSSGVGWYVHVAGKMTWLAMIGLGGAPLTVGASAPILGLLGATICYGHRTGSYSASRQAWSYALFMIVFGFVMPRVDNWAHIGGFAGGYLAGLLLQPQRRESPTDTALAILCLVATVASVVASLVDVRFYQYL